MMFVAFNLGVVVGFCLWPLTGWVVKAIHAAGRDGES